MVTELYLANPFISRKKTREWELEFEKVTDVKLINPFYDVERTDILDIDAGRKDRYSVDPDTIVNHDVGLIKKSDGVMAIVDGSTSIGTPMEMVYAYIDSKKVYLIVTNGEEDHPWLKYHACRIFTSYEEAINYFNRS